MKPEETVWVFQNVAYLKDVTRRKMRGGSHGLSIRTAGGIYRRPSSFRSGPSSETRRYMPTPE